MKKKKRNTKNEKNQIKTVFVRADDETKRIP